MHFYEREHSRMCLPRVCGCVGEFMAAQCVFSSLPPPPPTIPSPPMTAARSGRFYLQCDGVEIAGWGIITRAIKERFTGRPVSGVSTVAPSHRRHPPACAMLGHQRKEPKMVGGRYDLNMKVSNVAGSAGGICFTVTEAKALLSFLITTKQDTI